MPEAAILTDAGGAFVEVLARGPWFMALAAFGSGLLASLTPCVYPIIAITVSVFGARGASKRGQAFLLSGVFVLGLVASVVPLGLLASLGGKTFGAVLANRWFVVGTSALFLAFAASLFGAFEFDLPAALKTRLARLGGTGYAGAFFLGLVCGPLATPCTGPFLWSLLAWVAQTRSIALGGVAMTAFALGLGVPFFLVGALALRLPKPGRWMLHVESVMGVILSVVALYLLGIAFPVLRAWARPDTTFLVLSLVGVAAGVALGAIHLTFDAPSWHQRLRKGAGIAVVSTASFGFISGLSTVSGGLAWESPVAGQDLAQLLESAERKARFAGRPLLLDFTADWCAACKEIERDSFPDPRVQRAAARFVAVKADMTNDSDPAVEQTSARYEVRGLPTLILFDSTGQEATRFFGNVVSATELAEALERVN